MDKHSVHQLRYLLQRFGFLLLISLSVSFYTSQSVFAHNDAHNDPPISSEAFILIDATTGEILFERNMHKRMYPASITKIVTGIIAIEEGNPADIVTVSENARNEEGTRVYLEEGEQVPLFKLIQGLLISSGNDAGTAIAEHLSKSKKAFATKMNEFVRKNIGASRSHFTNPHGLFDEQHYTTAYDMAMITKYAMKNDEFRQIVGTNELEWIGEAWETTIYNHNRLIRQYEGATGVKNGYVQRSGYTLVGAAERNGTEFIAVTLNASHADLAYQDMRRLLDYGFEHYETIVIDTDQKFYINGQAYIPVQDMQMTVSMADQVQLRVKEEGMLQIIDKHHDVLWETKLSPYQEIVRNVAPSIIEKYGLIKKEGETVQDDHEASLQKFSMNQEWDSTESPAYSFLFWGCIFLITMFFMTIIFLLIRNLNRHDSSFDI